jgi:hypothetical protein
MNQLLKAFLWFFVLAGCIGANAGQWRLTGGGTFVGEEQWTEGDGWVGRVEGRSQNHILVSQSFRGGQVSKTARFEWAGAPQVLQPGELPPLPARVTIVQVTNPSGWNINVNVDCFIKTPYQSFWSGYPAMRQGGTLELRNTQLRIPEGSAGSKLILVYRILGFGTAKDTEFTYEWLGSASQGSGDRTNAGPTAALEGAWTINGRPTSITRGSGEPLIFTNEGGATSRGRFLDPNTVIAIDWAGGLRGTLENNATTIRWHNGTTWSRSAPGSTTIPNLAGRWNGFNTSGVSVGYGSETIEQNQSDANRLIFRNEGGSVSRGRFLNTTTVLAEDWEGGLRGTLENNATTIRWYNGTSWSRSAQGAPTLPNGSGNATVEPNRGIRFVHAPNGNWQQSHADTIMNYISWDGSRWTARIQGNGFVHAPNGNWQQSHADTIMNYISWDGSKWTAKIQGSGFVHAPNGNWQLAHTDIIINYITWDEGKWTAKIH